MYKTRAASMSIQEVLARINNTATAVSYTPVTYTASEIQKARRVLDRLKDRKDKRDTIASIREVVSEVY